MPSIRIAAATRPIFDLVSILLCRGAMTRPRTFFVAVAPKNFSALLARPVLLNGCPRSLSRPAPAKILTNLKHASVLNILVPGVGLEPTTSCEGKILSLLRKPFRHPGLFEFLLLQCRALSVSLYPAHHFATPAWGE